MSFSADSSNQSKGQSKAAKSAQSGIVVNGDPMPFSSGTVSDLLTALDIKTRAIAVELNHEVVPADQHQTTNISPGDRLQIVTLVGGG